MMPFPKEPLLYSMICYDTIYVMLQYQVINMPTLVIQQYMTACIARLKQNTFSHSVGSQIYKISVIPVQVSSEVSPLGFQVDSVHCFSVDHFQSASILIPFSFMRTSDYSLESLYAKFIFDYFQIFRQQGLVISAYNFRIKNLAYHTDKSDKLQCLLMEILSCIFMLYEVMCEKINLYVHLKTATTIYERNLCYTIWVKINSIGYLCLIEFNLT